jgi:adenylate cyclase
MVRQKFRRQERDGEFAFVFARDGAEALRAIEGKLFDLVVTDINMPGMDGLTLLSKLQERGEEALAAVIVSAYGDMANIRTAMNRGAFDFLTKPINFADLETTIAKTLRHVRAFREARQRRADAERAHASLARYFSPGLAEDLAADSSTFEIGGRRREVTAMFTDIAAFTSLVENTAPEVLSELLNSYFGEATTIVFSHGGTLAKVIGDALHVLFSAPREQPDHAERAGACALSLDAHLEEFRCLWRERGLELGETRIGIHSGPALVGNFGAGAFYDYTAYGDTINIAARLENANKALGTRVCMSATTARCIDSPSFRQIGQLSLRGRRDTLMAYEPLAAAHLTPQYREAYEKAYDLMAQTDGGAIAAFAALVGRAPQDRLASFHLKRLLNGASGDCIDLG